MSQPTNGAASIVSEPPTPSRPAGHDPLSHEPSAPGSLSHDPPSYPPTGQEPLGHQPFSQQPFSQQPPSGSWYPGGPAHRPSASPIGTAQERNWAVGAHLSGFVAAYLALGFLGPLVVMLTGGTRSAFVRQHAVEALNFNLSVLLWLTVSGLLTILLIGFPMLIAVGVLYTVCSIRGASAASRGEEYHYPFTIRMVS